MSGDREGGRPGVNEYPDAAGYPDGMGFLDEGTAEVSETPEKPAKPEGPEVPEASAFEDVVDGEGDLQL